MPTEREEHAAAAPGVVTVSTGAAGSTALFIAIAVVVLVSTGAHAHVGDAPLKGVALRSLFSVRLGRASRSHS